jgi:hypothetical protein
MGKFSTRSGAVTVSEEFRGVRSVDFSKLMSVHDSRGGLQVTTIESSDHYAMRGPGATVTIMEGMQEWSMLLATS